MPDSQFICHIFYSFPIALKVLYAMPPPFCNLFFVNMGAGAVVVMIFRFGGWEGDGG